MSTLILIWGACFLMFNTKEDLKMKKLVVLLISVLLLAGCTSKPKDLEVITIGGTALPHADFLRQLKDPLKELGYDLKVVEFDDYVLPNTALENGDLDANFFQHTPYLLGFNESHGTDLSVLLKVHYEPIAIYGGLKTDLESVKEGDTVLVPDDPTNLSRALRLLEQLGWISLAEGDIVELKDIVEYKQKVEIKLVSAENVAKQLDSAEYAIINANYALVAGVTDKGIKQEVLNDEVIANSVNVVAVRTGEESSEKSKAIVKAFNDAKVVAYVKDTYFPAVISVLGE